MRGGEEFFWYETIYEGYSKIYVFYVRMSVCMNVCKYVCMYVSMYEWQGYIFY